MADTAYDEVVLALRAAGCVFAEDEATLIMESAVSPDVVERFVAQRVAGVPLEVIVGWAELCGRRVAVRPGVFVPRRRTEVVVREASRLVGRGAVVVDLCCGTGAIGVALHGLVGGIDLHAADIEPAAVACARLNVEPLGGHVHEGDLFDALPAALRGRVDALLVNAPYVPTDAMATMPPEARLHEPRVTLDGGADGLDVHRRVAAGVSGWLAPGGHVLIETSRAQAPLTAATLRTYGLSTRFVTDDEVDGTAVVGTAVE